ncbi:hypothetical protein [Mycolicibacterium cosmeticum]|uniref:hypothetical protein n=1 Tax=Mycolicibacterium cosmeticum TaxID=258533 RepID=UPI0032047189
MHVYKVHVTRDGKWWMIAIPELDGYVTPDGAINVGGITQARSRGEVETMARDYISLVVGGDQFDLDVRFR